MSKELKDYLHVRGMATSLTTRLETQYAKGTTKLYGMQFSGEYASRSFARCTNIALHSCETNTSQTVLSFSSKVDGGNLSSFLVGCSE